MKKKEKKCNKHIKKNIQIKITRFIFIVCVCVFVCVCFSCVSILTNMKIKTNKWNNNNNKESEKWNEMRRRKTNKQQQQISTNMKNEEKNVCNQREKNRINYQLSSYFFFTHCYLDYHHQFFFPWIHKMLISSTGINSLGVTYFESESFHCLVFVYKHL